MKTKHRHVCLPVALTALALTSPIVLAQTLAQFDLPTQPLADSLRAVAAQTNSNILFDKSQVAGLSARPLKSQASTEQALEHLLDGTGLSYRRLDDKTVTIVARAGANEKAGLNLEEVIVTAYDFRAKVTDTATKMALAVHDTPQVVNVFNADVLEQLNVKDIGDLATYAPGLGAADSFNGTNTDRLFIRGFALQETGLKRDGYRVSDAAALDISLIDSIEVIKGPSSILDGYGSPGGVVNYRTKRPTSQTRYAAGVEYGSHGLRRLDTDVNLAPELSAFSLRIAGALQEADSFMDIDREKRSALSATAALDLGSDTRIELQGLFQRTQAKPNTGWAAQGGTRFPYVIPRSVFPGQPWNRAERENKELNLTLTHRLSSALKLDAFLSIGDDENEAMWMSVYDLGSFSGNPWRPGDTLEAYAVGNNNQFPQRRAELRLSGEYTLLGLRNTFAASTDYFRQKREGASLVPFFGFPAFDPLNPTYTLPEPVLDTYANSSVADRESIGAGLQNVVHLTDRLWILAGLRFDALRTSESRFSNLQREEKEEERFIPRLGVVRKINDLFNVYYSYSESYVPTAAFDRNYDILPAESSNQHEIGLKGSLFGGGLELQAAAFRVTRRDVAFSMFDPDAPNRFPSETIGKQRHSGFEVAAVGRVTPAWNLYASYAYLDTGIGRGEFDGTDVSGNEAALAPPHTVSLFSVYEFQRGLLRNWGLGGGIAHVAERWVTAENLAKLDSYTRIDANAFYKVTDHAQIRLSVTNLLDEDITTAQSESSIQGLVYADVREVRLSIDLRY